MTEKTRINAQAVARLAGVSQSAVSRTFTPGASISPATREKVLTATALLGYRPNALARSLITNRSYIIGVVMAYLDNQFYPDVLEKLASSLRSHNYQVLLFTGIKGRNVDPVAEQVLQYQLDGLILASTQLSSTLAETCVKASIPVVLLNRTTTNNSIYSVASNNRKGGKTVAEFLLAGKHRSFGYIAGLEDSSTNKEREKGFCDALANARARSPMIVHGDYSYSGAAQAARKLFSSPKRPEAVFCANDHMAMAVMDVARSEFGLKIPEDVSIVGYDNASLARWPAFDLTTIEQPADEMVAATVRGILEQIEGKPPKSRHAVLEGDLIVGTSARVPKSGVQLKNGRTVWIPNKALK